MLVLGIDTADKFINLGLVKEDLLLAEVSFFYENQQLVHLVPQIKWLLESFGFSPEDLDGIAVTTGPGSFTGLKLGLVTAKTLALLYEKKLVSISAMEALAYNVIYFQGRICPVIDAKKNELYFEIYTKKEGKLHLTEEKKLLTVQDFISEIKSWEKATIILGNGLAKIPPITKEPLQLYYPCPVRGSAVAFLGQEKLVKCEEQNIFALTPSYLRELDVILLKDQCRKRIT